MPAQWQSVRTSDASSGMPVGGCYLDSSNFGVHPIDFEGNDRKQELREWLEEWYGSPFTYGVATSVDNLPITVIIDGVEYPSTATRFTDITDGTSNYDPRVRILCDYVSQGATYDVAGRMLEIKEFNTFLGGDGIIADFQLPPATMDFVRPITILDDQPQVKFVDYDATKFLQVDGVAHIDRPAPISTQQTSWNIFVNPGEPQEEDSLYLSNAPVSFVTDISGTLTIDDYNMTLSEYKDEVLATSPNIYFQFGEGLQNLGSDVGDSLELLGNTQIVPSLDEEQWTFVDALAYSQVSNTSYGYSDSSLSDVLSYEPQWVYDKQPTNSGFGDYFFACSGSSYVRYLAFPSRSQTNTPTTPRQGYLLDQDTSSAKKSFEMRKPGLGTNRFYSYGATNSSSTFASYDWHWTEFADLDDERKQLITNFCNARGSDLPVIVVTEEDLTQESGRFAENARDFRAVYFFCANAIVHRDAQYNSDYRLFCMYATGGTGVRDTKHLSMENYQTYTKNRTEVRTGLVFDRRNGGVSPAQQTAYSQIFTFRTSLNPGPGEEKTGSNIVSPTFSIDKHYFYDNAYDISTSWDSTRGLCNASWPTQGRHEVHPTYRLLNEEHLDQLFGGDYKYDFYENMSTYLTNTDYTARFGAGVYDQGYIPTTTDEWITIGVVWERDCPEKPGSPRWRFYVQGVPLPYMYGTSSSSTSYETFPFFRLSIDGYDSLYKYMRQEYASAMAWDRALTDTEMRRLTGAPKTYVVEPPVSVIPLALSSEIVLDAIPTSQATLLNWFVVDYRDAYQGIADMAPDLYWNFSPEDVNQNVLTDASGNGRTGEFGRAFLANYQGNVWWRVPTQLEQKPNTTIANNPVVEPIVSLDSTSTFSYYLPTVVELDDGTVVDMRASLNAHWQFIRNTSSYRTRYSPLYFMVEDTEEIFTVNTGTNYQYNYAVYSYSNLNYWNCVRGSATEDVRAKFAPYAGKRVTLIGTGYAQLSYKDFYAAKQSPTATLTPGAVGFSREDYKSFISTTNPVIYWEFDTEGSTITNLGSAGSAGDATVTGGTWERNGWRRSPGDNVQSSYVWPTGGVESPITIMLEYEVVLDGASYSGIGPYLDFGTNTAGWKFEQYDNVNSRFRGTNSSSSYYAYGSFRRAAGTNGTSSSTVSDPDLLGQDTRRRRVIMRSQAQASTSTSSAYQNVSYSSIVPGDTAGEIPGQADRWSSNEYYESGSYGPAGVVNERIAIGLQDTINADYVVRRVAIWDRKLNDQEVNYLHGGPPGSIPARWRTVDYTEPSANVGTSPPNVQAVALKGHNASISGPWNESIDVDHTFYVAFRNNNGYATSATYSNGNQPFDYNNVWSTINFGFASNGWSRIEIDTNGNIIDPYYGSSDFYNEPYLPQVVPDHFAFMMYQTSSTWQPAFYSLYSSALYHSTPTEIDAQLPFSELNEWIRLVIQTRHNAEGGLEWRFQMNARPFADQQWSKWDLVGDNTYSTYYRALPYTKFGGQNSKPTHFYIEPPMYEMYDQETEIGAVAVWRRQLSDDEVAKLIYQNIGDSPLVGSVQMDIELPNADIIAIGGSELVLKSTLTLDVVPTATVSLPTGVAVEATIGLVDYEIQASMETIQILPASSSIEQDIQVQAAVLDLALILPIEGTVEADLVFEESLWLVDILYKEASSDVGDITLGPSTLDLIGQVQVSASADIVDVSLNATMTTIQILYMTTSADIFDFEIPAVVETRPYMLTDFLVYILWAEADIDLPEPELQASPFLTVMKVIDTTEPVNLDLSLQATPSIQRKLGNFSRIYLPLTLEATPTLTPQKSMWSNVTMDITVDPAELWDVSKIPMECSVDLFDVTFSPTATTPISDQAEATVYADLELPSARMTHLIYGEITLDVAMAFDLQLSVLPILEQDDAMPPLQFPPGSEGSQGTFGRLPNVTSGARKATGGSHSELPPKSC